VDAAFSIFANVHFDPKMTETPSARASQTRLRRLHKDANSTKQSH
jgi:hypothetical protein